MAGVGLLDRIHSEGANSIDGQLDYLLVYHGLLLSGWLIWQSVHPLASSGDNLRMNDETPCWLGNPVRAEPVEARATLREMAQNQLEAVSLFSCL
jgi:hypothetical protein